MIYGETMAKWILVSVVGILIGKSTADILVQPGFGQPRPTLYPQPELPPHFNPQRTGNLEAPQFGPVQPGYHLELHPVYGNLGHPTPGLGYLQSHDLSPYLSRAAQRRLYGAKVPALPVLPPHYLPVPVHNRPRRSVDSEPDFGVRREKRDKVDVAAKSSLNDNVPVVGDASNQDSKAAKRVEVRQSKNEQTRYTGALLGLNPSSMYPVQNQYQLAEPIVGVYRQIATEHPETVAQIATRNAMQEQTTAENQAKTSTPNTIPRVNLADLTHAMLLQQPLQRTATLQTPAIELKRNYPDPRPIVTEPQENQMKAQEAEDQEGSEDKEMVGSDLRHKHKIKTITHIHHHGLFRSNSDASTDAYDCGCSSPSYVLYNGNDAAANNLALVQQPAQVYQLPAVQQNYSPTEYVLQTYTNPINGWGYPTVSSPCMQNDNLPLAYQLA